MWNVWAGKVSEEFSSQLELEKELGLPISTFMQVPKLTRTHLTV